MKLMEYNTRRSVIRTILYKNVVDLPPIMGIGSYSNCVEADLEKLKKSAADIAK